MALLEFDGIGFAALAAAVPANTIDNLKYTDYFAFDEVSEIVAKTSIRERRFAPEGMCSSDLCFAAAENLFSKMELDRDSIDLVIFVSQTPDYRMPATAAILQHRLGLSTSTAAFDISLGCSGFVYALSVAYSFMLQPSFRRVLLMVGETRSRIYSPKDRKTAFLFGDGGVAALIEKQQSAGKSCFLLGTDGSLESLIKMDAGGYRNPSSVETLRERVVDEYGNVRSDEHGYMNGTDVFNFVLREIPSSITSLLKHSNKNISEIDYFVFHQANGFMNNYLAKKMKLPTSKVPSSVEKFGNTSSVSIPLTIVSSLNEELNERNSTLLLSGFGVGMSWASCVLNWNNAKLFPLIEI